MLDNNIFMTFELNLLLELVQGLSHLLECLTKAQFREQGEV